jgi:hypothetical protein
MTVSFATPAHSNLSGSAAPVDLALSGVTSGQPLVLVYLNINGDATGASIDDDFATPYTWLKVDRQVVTSGGVIETWIGTGGAGVSGTVVATPGATFGGFFVVPCVGASTAAGLAAIDVHGTVNVATPLALTPGAAGGGAVFGSCDNDAAYTSGAGAGWTDTFVTFSGSNFAVASTFPDTPHAAVTAAWGNASGVAFGAAAGLIVKEATVPPSDTGQMLLVM